MGGTEKPSAPSSLDPLGVDEVISKTSRAALARGRGGPAGLAVPYPGQSAFGPESFERLVRAVMREFDDA